MIDLNQLAADPSYLVRVLENNLLMTGLLKNRLAPNGVIGARFAPSKTHCVDRQNSQVPVYNLYNDGVNAHDSVPAYLCAYEPRQTHSVTLGGHANFVFTTTMNGCTFAVGPNLANGTRRVSHSNVGGDPVAQRQATAQVHGTNASLFGLKLLEPATYRMGLQKVNATTFGVKVNGQWQFYFQSYEMIGGGQVRLHGVFPF